MLQLSTVMPSIEYNYASNSLMEQFPKNNLVTQTIYYATQMTSLYCLLESKLSKKSPSFPFQSYGMKKLVI